MENMINMKKAGMKVIKEEGMTAWIEKANGEVIKARRSSLAETFCNQDKILSRSIVNAFNQYFGNDADIKPELLDHFKKDLAHAYYIIKMYAEQYHVDE